jgi:cell division protein FtsW (lipid II flippase)
MFDSINDASRRREVILLALACAFVLAAAAALALIPFARANTWNPGVGSWNLGFGVSAAVWAACALTSVLVLRRTLPDHDPFLLPLVFLLTGWGLALIWRLAPRFAMRQTAWLVIATVAMVVIASLPGNLRWLRRYRYTWLLVGLALTALTLIFGVNPSGAGERLWLGCCGMYLQPAEILKLLLVVFLAAYLADRREPLFQPTQPEGGPRRLVAPQPAYFFPMLLAWGFSMLILVSQRDLGMSTLFFAVFLVMLYLASGRMEYIAVGFVLLVLGGVLGYFLFDVVRLRVEAWWNPWADASGRSYQIVQSLIALAAGGLFGRGPGLGAPTLIPVAHSDYIFAALTEEWGLAGALAAISLLGALVFRGLRIALTARGGFEQLLAGGLATLAGLQALMIMGGVVKLVPLTGVTLPFMSYGGSSLVTHFLMIGLLLRLSSVERRRTMADLSASLRGSSKVRPAR